MGSASRRLPSRIGVVAGPTSPTLESPGGLASVLFKFTRAFGAQLRNLALAPKPRVVRRGPIPRSNDRNFALFAATPTTARNGPLAC